MDFLTSIGKDFLTSMGEDFTTYSNGDVLFKWVAGAQPPVLTRRAGINKFEYRNSEHERIGRDRDSMCENVH